MAAGKLKAMTTTANQQTRIKAMSAELASRVAAGEVIARPASVVKELVENSLDAGARHIEIQLEQGGLRLIQVRDDGQGIHPEDLELAVTQHASSKLNDASQLACIMSLGFRGEALASIAVVSHFKLISKMQGQDQAQAICRNASERDSDLQPAAHPVGTTVTVRDIFYNVPARRKFLRTPRTEFNHIEDVLRRLALSRFNVAFTVYHNKERIWQLLATKDVTAYEHRLAKLMSSAFIKSALAIDIEAVGLRLHGWLAKPSFNRSQSDWQLCYLNGRAVRDKILMHAIRSAYDVHLPAGRYPAYVLFLECDASEVDVNVHPTKHEVQFRNVRWVHDFVQQSVKKALQTEPAEVVSTSSPQIIPSQTKTARPRQHKELTAPTKKPVELQHYQALYGQSKTESSHTKSSTPKPQYSEIEILGVVANHTIIAWVEQQFLFINAQQAQHIIALERLQASAKWSSDALLEPKTQRLTTERMAKVTPYLEVLLSYGVELAPLDDHTLVLRALPNFMNLDLLGLINELQNAPDPSALLNVLTQHATLRSYDPLTRTTALALVVALAELKQPAAIAQRRLAFSIMTTDELTKRYAQTAIWPVIYQANAKNTE